MPRPSHRSSRRTAAAVLLAVLVLATGYLPAPWPVDVALAGTAVFLATSRFRQARFTLVPAVVVGAWALLTNLAFIVPLEINARLAALLLAVVISGLFALRWRRDASGLRLH